MAIIVSSKTEGLPLLSLHDPPWPFSEYSSFLIKPKNMDVWATQAEFPLCVSVRLNGVYVCLFIYVYFKTRKK